MKKLAFILLTFIGFSCCTQKEVRFQKTEVRIPVIEKYQTTRQFSVFPTEIIWVAKLANGDSIKSYQIPQDTVTFIYYKKIN